MTYRKSKKVFIWIGLLFLFFLLLMGTELYRSNHTLSCSYYEISTEKIDSRIRIVQLTDLHNSEFGKENEKLVDLIAEQSPDLILLTGDLVKRSEKDTMVVTNLLRKLKEIAPVYVSLGNHEVEYEENYGGNLTELYEAAGAFVLDKEYMDIDVKGQQLRLGGIYGYCLPEKYLATKEADAEECAFLSEFQDTSAYKILMCHMPVCWMINGSLDEWDVDCVFAGHVHGGQVVLPYLGGLYGPDLGWFPGRLSGLFYSAEEESVLVLSRGLGSNGWVPRWNNVPEIVVTDIVPLS